MRFRWQSQHIEYHAANFPRVLHFSALCMHAYIVRHCNCAGGLHFSAFILQEVKGLTNKLYAYALARKKTGLNAVS